MKKTLTINLGGTVYHIDDDAYRLLDNYLNNLRLHFKKQEGADEIVNDMENRIAELFSEKLSVSKQVITIIDVEEVIARMGRPEDFGDENDNPASGEKSDEDERTEQKRANAQTTTARRRLFRDPDDKLLGGVAAGLAAYLGWDVTLVRILTVILAFMPYCPVIILYLIGWIVIPEARTAAEKLSMRGEAVTVENIGKTVTDGFERVANGVNDYVNTGKPRSFLQKVADAFLAVIAFIFKMLLVVLAVVLCPFLFVAAVLLIVALIAIFAVIFGAGTAIFSVLPTLPSVFGTAMAWDSPWLFVSLIVLVLFVGIPVFALIHTILRMIFNWNPMSRGVRNSLLVTWIITLPLTLIFLFLGYFTFIPKGVHYEIRTNRITTERCFNKAHSGNACNKDTLRLDNAFHK